MAQNKNDQVIVAIFDSYVAADKAVNLLQEWDQANDEVKSAATYSTTSSEEEGFATAVERYVLNNRS